MITIIHGDDIVSSRKYFLDLKQKYPYSHMIEGEQVTLTDLAQLFEGGGFFDESKTVFIEHFFKRKKSRKAGSRSTEKNVTEFEILTNYLQKQTTHTIFLWEGKELERSSQMIFKTAIPRVFKLPQTLFVLLDNLKPGNGKQLISLFHQTLQSTEAEMIFFMLVRQLRLLLGLLQQSDDPIDELKRLAPWQKSKLQQQASLFTQEQLVQLYQRLFTIETGQKTGTLPNTILTSIDFLLLGI